MNESLIGKVLERHQLHEIVRVFFQQLNTNELTTVLSYVFAIHASTIEPAMLRNAMTTDRFVKPSTVSPRSLHQFEGLPKDYKLVELSPLAPWERSVQ